MCKFNPRGARATSAGIVTALGVYLRPRLKIPGCYPPPLRFGSVATAAIEHRAASALSRDQLPSPSLQSCGLFTHPRGLSLLTFCPPCRPNANDLLQLLRAEGELVKVGGHATRTANDSFCVGSCLRDQLFRDWIKVSCFQFGLQLCATNQIFPGAGATSHGARGFRGFVPLPRQAVLVAGWC